MNSILNTPPPPHQLSDPRLSPSRSMSNLLHATSITNRKRKASGEDDSGGNSNNDTQDERMSTSPGPHHRHGHNTNISSSDDTATRRPSPKRSRTEPVGRCLSLPRLLETLDADSLRSVLRDVVTRHPHLGSEIETLAPRPSVASALAVLQSYASTLRSAFPFGGDPASDYAYNRVRPHLVALLSALQDFVPSFLPSSTPSQQPQVQVSQSLAFLDGATDLIHALPQWHSFTHNLHKADAYDAIAKAWLVALREASKRPGAGMSLKYEGWDVRVKRHNELSGGKLDAAVVEVRKAVGWMTGSASSASTGVARTGEQLGTTNDGEGGGGNVRQELLSGTYGANLPVGIRLW